MSERISINAQPRDVKTGKKAKQLRREGLVPAVVYGQGDTKHLQFSQFDLRRALRSAGSNELIEIDLGEANYTVLTRDIQKHPIRGDLLHVDFYEVNMQEKIDAEVTLITVGEPDSELRTLGMVTQLLHAIDVECLPGDLVSEIEVDISVVESPDDVIYVSDLVLPEGLTLLTDPGTTVTSFNYFREEEEEEEEEELMFAPDAGDVEVIGKGKDEEEGFEEEEEPDIIDL